MENIEMSEVGTDVNQVEITSLSKIRGQKKVSDLLKVNLDAYFQSRTTTSEKARRQNTEWG